MLREGHQKTLQFPSQDCVPGSVWASRVPPGSPGDCSLELTSELSPEQQMCSLSGGGADGLGKGASQGSRATKQGAVPSSRARLFLLISQETALKPGKTGVPERREQSLPACLPQPSLDWGRTSAFCSYTDPSLRHTTGKGGSHFHSRTGSDYGKDTHTHKDSHEPAPSVCHDLFGLLGFLSLQLPAFP